MKTYLVTGATGFFGNIFIKYLLYKKYKDEDIRIIRFYTFCPILFPKQFKYFSHICHFLIL